MGVGVGGNTTSRGDNHVAERNVTHLRTEKAGVVGADRVRTGVAKADRAERQAGATPLGPCSRGSHLAALPPSAQPGTEV